MAFLDETGLAELWSLIGDKYGGILEHTWKRQKFIAAHATETPFTNKYFEFANSSSYTSYIYYSDTIEISSDGTVSLGGDPKSIMDNYQTISAYGAGTLAGKYFEVYKQRVATGEIYYFDPSATMTATTNNSYTYKYGFTISAGKKITGVAASYGDVEYLQSNNRNAYPDSGVNNGYVYWYCGIPLENAITSPKVAIGSYRGTDAYGSGSPNSLVFDFEPKTIILGPSMRRDYGKPQKIDFEDNWLFVCKMLSTDYVNPDSGVTNVYAKVDGNTFFWYCTESASRQKNSSTYDYYYIAIG